MIMGDIGNVIVEFDFFCRLGGNDKVYVDIDSKRYGLGIGYEDFIRIFFLGK